MDTDWFLLKRIQKLEDVKISNINSGYGSSTKSSNGKYAGFGNTPNIKQESIVNQVYEFVGNAMASSEKNREAYLRSLMVSDKGNYKPITAEMLEWRTPLDDPPVEGYKVKGHTVKETLPLQSSGLHKYGPPILHSSVVTPRGKGYSAGKAGGGWASDEDEEDTISLQKMSFVENEANVNEKSLFAEEEFINQFMDIHNLWPIRKFDVFLKTGTQMNSLGLNKEKILMILVKRISDILDTLIKDRQKKLDDLTIPDSKEVEYTDLFCEPWQPNIPKIEGNEAMVMILLLLIEYCYHDWCSILIVNKVCFSFLNTVGEFKGCHSCIRNKAQKLLVYLKLFMANQGAKAQQNS